MKKITSRIFTYETLVEENCLYVDKTPHLKRLLDEGMGSYLFTRPRRFGKSLLVTTLQSIFQGKKELFKGTYIYDSDYAWKKYPVIKLNLGDCGANTPEKLETYLQGQLELIAEDYGILLSGEDLPTKFAGLMRQLSKQSETKRVVILIDEYDMPIFNNAFEPQIDDILRTLKNFYGTIKACDEFCLFRLHHRCE